MEDNFDYGGRENTMAGSNISITAGIFALMYEPLSKKVAMHKEKGEWKDAWGIELKPIDKDKESLSFDLIGCPFVAFAQKFGYKEIMPVLCRSDYITIRQLGAKMIRPQIVADGYERCTFTYVPDKDNT